MAKLSLWKPIKTKDFNFIDTVVREQFYVGSVGIYVHKYLGVIDQGDVDDKTQKSEAQSAFWNELTIQDLTFMENRNRKYSDTTFEMRGHYTHADSNFELMQFNLGISDGTRYIIFHLNDMIDKIGRKLVAGDVIEMPSLRDDALLGEDSPAINQWFVITDASWPSEGFSATWYPHLWRIKAKPMTDSPEFSDILKNEDGDYDPLKDFLSTYNKDKETNDAVVAQANETVPKDNLNASHIYVVPGDEFGSQYPWLFAGDDTPPNNSIPAESGTSYPSSATVGDYFLRTDYEPSRLFQYTEAGWKYVEVDFRQTWNNAHRIMESYFNNDNTFERDGETIPEKQPINKALKPRPDDADR